MEFGCYSGIRKEIIEALDWLNKDLLNWLEGLNHLDSVIEVNRNKIE